MYPTAIVALVEINRSFPEELEISLNESRHPNISPEIVTDVPDDN
jgi:hypothetical protein